MQEGKNLEENRRHYENTVSQPSADRFRMRQKWRNLIQTFRKLSDKKKKTGRGAVHWKFYEAMQMATKDSASIQPGANVLVSSMQDQVQVPTMPDTPEKSPNVPESTATREASPMKSDASVQTPTKATRKRKAQR